MGDNVLPLLWGKTMTMKSKCCSGPEPTVPELACVALRGISQKPDTWIGSVMESPIMKKGMMVQYLSLLADCSKCNQPCEVEEKDEKL